MSVHILTDTAAVCWMVARYQTSMDALYLMLFFVLLGMIVFGTVIFYCEVGTLNESTGKIPSCMLVTRMG